MEHLQRCHKSVHPDSASREDMRAFKVIAWTDNPYKIPKFRFASFSEPEFNEAGHVFEPEFAAVSLRRGRRSSSINTLRYKVLFHLHSVVDHSPPSDRPGSPSDDDSGQRTGSLAHRSLTMVQGDITLLSVGDRWTDRC